MTDTIRYFSRNRHVANLKQQTSNGNKNGSTCGESAAPDIAWERLGGRVGREEMLGYMRDKIYFIIDNIIQNVKAKKALAS